MTMIRHSKITCLSFCAALRFDRNYLQSPYFFMCCNLWDATEDRHIQQDSTAVLAGTLVSSLHRLKDIDNTGKPMDTSYTDLVQY